MPAESVREHAFVLEQLYKYLAGRIEAPKVGQQSFSAPFRGRWRVSFNTDGTVVVRLLMV